MRDQLTLITGAGFSVPFSIPSSKLLSDAIERIRVSQHVTNGTDVQISELLHEALRREYVETNFELALHGIESLLSYIASEHSKGDLAGVRQVLHAFTEMSQRWIRLNDFNRLEVLRRQIIRKIVRMIDNSEFSYWPASEPQPKEIRSSSRFINELLESFSLRAFTLNYDTLLDRHSNWNDGFRTGSPAKFSRRIFQRKLTYSEPLLCHLHGSILFGYDEDGRIVRYPDVRSALNSYKRERPLKPSHGGEPTYTGPIISGYRKLDKIITTPYSYYYNALISAIINNPRLIVIGYGFKDSHLNYWLGQHKTIHGEKRRVVLVRKDMSPKRILRVDKGEAELRSVYAGLSHELWNDREIGYFERKQTPRLAYFRSRELLVLLSGYPLRADARQLVLDHVTS
jgi:hypothetical protein